MNSNKFTKHNHCIGTIYTYCENMLFVSSKCVKTRLRTGFASRAYNVFLQLHAGTEKRKVTPSLYW